MSPSNGPGGGGVAGMIPPSSALSSYSRGAGSRKGSANVDLKQIAEKLVNNEELLSLLARKLGLPEPKKPIYKGNLISNNRTHKFIRSGPKNQLTPNLIYSLPHNLTMLRRAGTCCPERRSGRLRFLRRGQRG